jgi:hypothetical protein
MATRRDALVATGLGVALMLLELRSAQAQVPSGCLPSDSEAAAFALSARYVAAVNAGNAAALPAIFAEDYIQHSGRSPSGLAGQIANFHAIRTVFPISTSSSKTEFSVMGSLPRATSLPEPNAPSSVAPNQQESW